MSLQAFTVLAGRAAPLLLSNVDTDVIIRIDRMSRPRGELGGFAFEALRFRPDGSDDPNFVLNQPAFRGATILLGGPNFGCGSSREAAVWALMGVGIRCVIAPSYGDIFFGNCIENGVLPVVLDELEVAALAAATRAGRNVSVDLVHQQVTADGGRPMSFLIDRLRREQLIAGLDAVDLALQDRPSIVAWQAADRVRRPWVWNTARE